MAQVLQALCLGGGGSVAMAVERVRWTPWSCPVATRRSSGTRRTRHSHPWDEIEVVEDRVAEFLIGDTWTSGGPGTVQLLPAACRIRRGSRMDGSDPDDHDCLDAAVVRGGSMTDEMPSDMESAGVSYPVEMRPADVAFIRTALRVRLSTLGRVEAEEVDEVNALLARQPDVRARDDLH